MNFLNFIDQLTGSSNWLANFVLDRVLHQPKFHYFHLYLQDAYEEELQILSLYVLPAVSSPNPVYENNAETGLMVLGKSEVSFWHHV